MWDAHPTHPLPGAPSTTAPSNTQNLSGGGKLDGKGLDPFNHHFLLAGTKPPLTGWKRTSIFLLGFIQCQKAFTASARVLGMQRQRPGQAGSQPPRQPPAPGEDTSEPPSKAREPLWQGSGLGAKAGVPELWFNPAGKLHSSELAGDRDGEGGSCAPQLWWGLLNQTLVVLARKRGMQVPASPWAPSSASLQQSTSCNHPGKALQIPN